MKKFIILLLVSLFSTVGLYPHDSVGYAYVGIMTIATSYFIGSLVTIPLYMEFL